MEEEVLLATHTERGDRADTISGRDTGRAKYDDGDETCGCRFDDLALLIIRCYAI